MIQRDISSFEDGHELQIPLLFQEIWYVLMNVYIFKKIMGRFLNFIL
jgi:hypothetical protein